MLRLTQLRLAAALLAAGLISVGTASAWAFSQQIVSPGAGGSTLTDPGEQLTSPDNQNSGQGVHPFGSNGPTLQFGVQQSPSSTFGRGNGYNSTPDPYFRSLTNGN